MVKKIKQVYDVSTKLHYLWYQYRVTIYSQSTPESWAQFTHDNIVRGEHERMASIQLRQLIDNILSDTSRDMREQCDTVDVCFQKRLEEMEDSKSKMEENLRKVQVLNSYYTASSHPVC